MYIVSNWQTLSFCNVSISLFNEIQDYYIVWFRLVYFYLHKHFWHIQIRVIFLCAICLCYFNLCICRVMLWYAICYAMIWYDIDKSNIYIFIVAVDDLDSQIKYSQPENCLFISPKKTTRPQWLPTWICDFRRSTVRNRLII